MERSLTIQHADAPSEDGGPRFLSEWLAIAADWRSRWGVVLRSKSLGSDLLAGLTVAAVALPLNVALAVASGLPPSAGLIAGAVGGPSWATRLYGAAALACGAGAVSALVFLIGRADAPESLILPVGLP